MSTPRIYYGLLLAGYFGTLILLTAWFAWAYPPQKTPVALALLLIVGPLLLPMRGILHARRYTISWSCFLALLYFTHGVLEAWHTAPTRTLGMVEVALTTLWFVSAIGYIQASKQKPAHTDRTSE